LFVYSKGDTVNFLLITADDMNWDAVGAFGAPVPDVTPNLDHLASEGVRFKHAHVTAAVCQPSREVLMTGRYPHRNGGMGFEPIWDHVETLQERLSQAGYLNGILGKVKHLAPEHRFKWDDQQDIGDLGHGRDPEKYGDYAEQFFSRAKGESRPFFLMANAHDPHRPFVGSEQEAARFGDDVAWIPPPSATFRPEEVVVPGFLPDIPDVRLEIAQYYNSCRRCDDTVGAVLAALDTSGLADDTLVMFLSDNGMAFPFAKTNCYLNSTRTPWIVRWPGTSEQGKLDEEHFISSIDFTPTILDIAELEPISDLDGKSFAGVLRGQVDRRRDRVFTVFHKTSAGNEYPMRGVQTEQYGYVFNAWADGKTEFKNESQSGLTFRAMDAAAKEDQQIMYRVHEFRYRTPEELFDFKNDPDALNNLIDHPDHQNRRAEFRQDLFSWMQEVKDPLVDMFPHGT
jgi:N-sulfoglucosamine sulfohydrolase